MSSMLNVDFAARLPVIVFLSLTTLSLPTVLMGATLPFLVRFLTRSRTELANRSVLYTGSIRWAPPSEHWRWALS